MWYDEDVARPEFRIEYKLKAGINAEQYTQRAMKISVEYISTITNDKKTYSAVTHAWGKEVSDVQGFITVPDNDVKLIRKIELTIGRGTAFEKFIDTLTGKEVTIVISSPDCRLHWTTNDTSKTEFVITGQWKPRKQRSWVWVFVVLFLIIAAAAAATAAAGASTIAF